MENIKYQGQGKNMKIIEHNPYKETKKKNHLMLTKVLIAHELLTK
jgi:hypothetical protein